MNLSDFIPRFYWQDWGKLGLYKLRARRKNPTRLRIEGPHTHGYVTVLLQEYGPFAAGFEKYLKNDLSGIEYPKEVTP